VGDLFAEAAASRQAENAPPTPDRTVRRPEPEETDTSMDVGDAGDMESLGEEI